MDGVYGVVTDIREHRGVLLYSVLLDQHSPVGPVYGMLHEFEVEPAGGENRKRPLVYEIARFVATRVKRRPQPN